MKRLALAILLMIGSAAESREFVQNGNAMEPTIMDREAVEVGVLTSFFYEPERWDVVAYKNPTGQSNLLIGRIVGMPNEIMQIKNEGLFINGKRIELPQRLQQLGIKYLPPYEVLKKPEYRNMVYKIGENEYFILGDNSRWANDSRFQGPINGNAIANKVVGK